MITLPVQSLIQGIQKNALTCPEFLRVRAVGETNAKHLLNRFAGAFTPSSFHQFCEAWNQEQITFEKQDQPRCTRFNQGLASTVKISKDPANLVRFNAWVSKFWKNPPANDSAAAIEFDNLLKANIQSCKTLLFSVILYLGNAELYLPCTDTLERGMAWIMGRKTFAPINSGHRFIQFTRDARSLMRDFNLKPQEVDYVLFKARTQVEKNRIIQK